MKGRKEGEGEEGRRRGGRKEKGRRREGKGCGDIQMK